MDPGERIYEEEFDELFHLIVKSGHLHDKLMKILRALLCPKDDQHPFVIGSDKTRVNLLMNSTSCIFLIPTNHKSKLNST